jgi:bacteriocin-like protein
MDNMNELNLNELENVTGGSTKTVQTRKAIVRSGPGLDFSQNGTLSHGTVVNFSGTVSYNNAEGQTWYLINSPVYGWVTKKELGV